MNRYVLIRALFIATCLLLVSQALKAQDDGYSGPSNFRGVLPSAAYQTGSIDNIALGTGTVNIRIPLTQRKGRGLDQSFDIVYSSKIWVPVATYDPVTHQMIQFTWDTSYTAPVFPQIVSSVGGMVEWLETTYSCNVGFPPVQKGGTILSNYFFLAPDGTRYSFPNRGYNGYQYCNGVNYTTVIVGVSNEGTMELDTPQNTVRLKNGNAPAEDTNGNLINLTYRGTLLTAATDTVKRNYTFANFLNLNFMDSNGNSQTITYQAGSGGSTTTNFPTTTCGPAPIHQGNWSPFPVSITLPNGRSFVFHYDPVFGELTRLDLPTGGYISYVYATFAAGSAYPAGDPPPLGANFLCRIDARRVTERHVSSDGVTEQVWRYAYSLVNSSNVTTVTDPVGNVTVHTFDVDGIHEKQVDYQNSSGTTLRTIANTWAYDTAPVQTGSNGIVTTGQKNWRVTGSNTTLTDTNQVSRIEMDYDTYSYTLNAVNYTESRANVLAKREFNFGTGSPGPLLRRTSYTFLHDSNTNYLNKHILDRVASRTVYDSINNTCLGQSQACAQTTYGYDTTTIATQSGVVQHDYTNYPASMIYRGNLTEIRRWRNSDGAFLTTTKWFDELGNIKQIQDPLSHNTFVSYTDFWATNPPSATTCNPSGGAGNALPTRITDAASHVTTAVYFSCSSLDASITDPNGQTVSYAYDLLDRELQTNNQNGSQTSNVYNESSTPVNVTTTTKITNGPLNMVSTVYMDGLGRAHKTVLSSDPDGSTYTRTDYDALGRNATAWNSTRCDPDINPTSCAGEATFGTTQFQYDALGRTTKVIPPDGSTSSNNVSTTYAGNCATVTDQTGKIRKSCSDGLGRLTQVFEPDSGNNLTNETDYQFNVLDNLTRVDQKGNTTDTTQWRSRTFTYNSLSQLICSSSPELAIATCPNPDNGSYTAGTIRYTYDNDGNVSSKVSPQPNQTNPAATITVSYCYDSLHRLTSKAFNSQACPMTSPVATYSYDSSNCLGQPTCFNIGQRTGMTDAAGSEAWSYSDVSGTGRKVVEQRTTNGVTKSTTYQYNLDGSLASLIYPSGRTVTYGPGGAGKSLSAIDQANSINYAMSVHYAPQGAVSSVTNGGNIVSTFYYDNRLQPCRMFTTTGTTNPTSCTDSATGNVADFTYSFNLGVADNGNPAIIANNRNHNRDLTYTYDELDRIKTAITTGTSGTCWGLDYSYDIWGNLKTVSLDPSRPGSNCSWYTLNGIITNQNHLQGYSYDAAGNILNDGVYSYSYDAENHITTGAGVSYIYDGDGKRAQKSSGKLYWYGTGSDPLAESDLSGNLTDEFAFFRGKRIARRNISSGNIFYYFADHLDTSRVILQSGQTTPCYDADLDPFGGEHIFTNSCPQNYKLTGKERDPESGLDAFGARHYASLLGRFVSADHPRFSEKSDPQTWNLYSYVSNNPLSRIDPTGNNWFWLHGGWYWYNGSNVDNKGKPCIQGSVGCYHSDYTHLIIIQKTGHTNEQGAAEVIVTLRGNCDPHSCKPIAQAYGFSGSKKDGSAPNGKYEINLNNRGGVDTNRLIAVEGGIVLEKWHDGIQEVGKNLTFQGESGYDATAEWGTLRANLSRNGQGTPYYLHGKGLFFSANHTTTAGCVCEPYQKVLEKIFFSLSPSDVGEGEKNGRIAVSVQPPTDQE